MAIDFPSSPANNQTYTYGTQTWYWANNIGAWVPSVNSTFTSNVTVSNTADLVLSVNSGISANGSLGTLGQVLTSNGDSVYWSTATITQVDGIETEIAADSPLAWWKFNETSGTTITNYGSLGSNADLTLNGSWVLGAAKIVPSSPDSYAFCSTSSSYASSANQIFTVPVNYDTTLEAILLLTQDGTNLSRIMTLAAVGETAATNYQTSMYMYTGGEMFTFWEYSSGTNVSVDSNVQINRSVPVHVVFVKDATAKTVTFYVNGIKTNVVGYANEPTGGTSGFWRIGNNSNDTTSRFTIAHAACYNTQLSDDRIYAHARAAGLASVPGYVIPADANNASYLGGIIASGYQTTSGLSANVATLTSNNSTYAFGKSESGLNVNSALTSNNSTYSFGKSESGLNVNNSLTSNNASYLGGTAAANFVQNTDSRTLSGNLNFTGSNTYFSGKTTFNANIVINTAAGISANGSFGLADQVLTTNGSSVYWSTVSGGGGGGFTNGSSISVNNFVITGAFTANSSNGSSGQVLTTNGSAVYWSTVSGGGGGGGVSTNTVFGYNMIFGG